MIICWKLADCKFSDIVASFLSCMLFFAACHFCYGFEYVDLRPKNYQSRHCFIFMVLVCLSLQYIIYYCFAWLVLLFFCCHFSIAIIYFVNVATLLAVDPNSANCRLQMYNAGYNLQLISDSNGIACWPRVPVPVRPEVPGHSPIVCTVNHGPWLKNYVMSFGLSLLADDCCCFTLPITDW